MENNSEFGLTQPHLDVSIKFSLDTPKRCTEIEVTANQMILKVAGNPNKRVHSLFIFWDKMKSRG